MSRKKKLEAWIFWIIIWQIMSILVDMEIFLPSPVAVLKAIFEMILLESTWMIIGTTSLKIMGGFLLGVLVASCFALLASRSVVLESLFVPIMITVKSIPVASFIILILICFSSNQLSVVIGFLMVVPVLYQNLLEGIKQIDKELIEMAQIFGVGIGKRIFYIHFIQVYPYLKAGIATSVGLAFKAGIAAEVIGSPRLSIGEQIFQAKIYLDTVHLFAWTVVVVLLSLFFEKCILFGMDYLKKQLER